MDYVTNRLQTQKPRLTLTVYFVSEAYSREDRYPIQPEDVPYFCELKAEFKGTSKASTLTVATHGLIYPRVSRSKDGELTTFMGWNLHSFEIGDDANDDVYAIEETRFNDLGFSVVTVGLYPTMNEIAQTAAERLLGIINNLHMYHPEEVYPNSPMKLIGLEETL